MITVEFVWDLYRNWHSFYLIGYGYTWQSSVWVKHFYFLDDFLSELARVLGSMLTTQYSILWGRPKAETAVCAPVEAAGGCMEAEGCMLLLKAKQPHAESMLSEQAYTSAMAAHTGLLHAIGAHLSGTTLSMLAFWVRMFQQRLGLDTLSKLYCEQ